MLFWAVQARDCHLQPASDFRLLSLLLEDGQRLHLAVTTALCETLHRDLERETRLLVCYVLYVSERGMRDQGICCWIHAPNVVW